MMKVSLDGNDPCRYLVSSESEGNKEYIVDLCEYPRGTDENGVTIFNGACGLTHDRIMGCKDFIFRCEPQLKKPENKGKIFRCKHIKVVRDYALTLLLPHLNAHRPNLPEDQTP